MESELECLAFTQKLKFRRGEMSLTEFLDYEQWMRSAGFETEIHQYERHDGFFFVESYHRKYTNQYIYGVMMTQYVSPGQPLISSFCATRNGLIKGDSPIILHNYVSINRQ